jgi:hypothetical protein
MASSSATPGSLAEKLRSTHAANADPHGVTVEDVIDEDDIEHPPPVLPTKSAKKFVAPNLKDDSEFPSLGPAKPPVVVPGAWGAAAAGVSNGASNGTSSVAAGKARVVPVQAPTAAASKMNLPNRVTEHIAFAAHQLKPRTELKRPVPEILRDINKKSKAQVTYREGPNKTLVFQGVGPEEAVRVALKELATQVGSTVSVQPWFTDYANAMIAKGQDLRTSLRPSILDWPPRSNDPRNQQALRSTHQHSKE